MGTPVVAIDVAPQNEYVTHLANGLVVPAPVRHTPVGAPWAGGGLDAFEEAVAALADDPVRLADLRAGATAGLARRRREFEAGWAAVLAGR
jgi:glycosyltransferase involved in cell wall biosynthesis